MAKSNLQRNEECQKTVTISDSDTSDKESLPLHFPTTDEKRHYNTVPGSALATKAAFNHSMAQENLTVERGPPKTKVKKLPQDKAKDKSSQTDTKRD